MMRYLFLASFVFSSFVGTAKADELTDGEIVVPPACPVPQVTAQYLFDCLEGPGYLRVTSVNVYNQKASRTVFLGSRKACQAQVVELKKTRSQVTKPSVAAVCTPKATYMVRWNLTQFGEFVSLPQVYYADTAECLKDAAELNARN